MKRLTAAMAWVASVTAATAAPAQTYYLPSGAPVELITRTELNTKDNRAGYRFYLEVAESVRAMGQVIIPAGSIAVGEVVRSERNGHFGKSGKIDTRLLYIDMPDRRIPLGGRSNERGKSGAVGTVFATIAFGIVGGLVVHGTSGYIRAGTPVTAYTREDILFALRAPEPGQAARGTAIRADIGVTPTGYGAQR